MALATFADLKSAITDWMIRTDVAGSAEDFITLAEAHLNREIDPIRKEATLATVTGSREVSTSALSIDQPVALFLDRGTYEVKLPRMSGSSAANDEISREPERWEWDANSDSIKFDAPADAVYNLRFEYDERFALSDSATTNDLLTNHPDVYLTASLVWGAGYVKDPTSGMDYARKLMTLLPSVKRHYAQRRRAPLKMPAGLQHRSRYDDDWRD
jgi:hypothetical protein